jgi:hypothetical protein
LVRLWKNLLLLWRIFSTTMYRFPINYTAKDMCAPKRDDEAAVCGTIVGDAAICGNNDW